MSNTIFKTKTMEVNDFCGKNGNASVGVNIRGKATYGFNQAQLTESQVKRLINVLKERIKKI